MRSLLLAGAVCVFAAAAQAQTPPVVALSAAPSTTASTPPPGSAAIDTAELATLNGRRGETLNVALSDQDLTAVSRGNVVNADTVGSGQISIDNAAFQGFAGIGNFVINSGQNNTLQGAITINIVSP